MVWMSISMPRPMGVMQPESRAVDGHATTALRLCGESAFLIQITAVP
jgi:hypothetical protein